MVGFTTEIVHSDRRADIEHGSIHKPVHSNVAYGYEDARDLADTFQGKGSGWSYGRQINPTVDALETKISKMENGLATVAFSTGMVAIGTMLFALLRDGDHFISSQFLFGNTNSLFNSFGVQGVDVSFVDATSVELVERAITKKTRLVFVETVANPRTQVSDLKAIGELCRARGLVYVVDNTMTSPYLFQPVSVGASLIVNSLTKYICGHGNALGGAVTETGLFDWGQFPNIYETYQKGEVLIGSETLALRMERQCSNAVALAQYLSAHEKIQRIYYPGLMNHPQYERAKELFAFPGAILSFELASELDPFAFLNKLEVVIKSSNLGDNRTLAIPVAHTIYYEMGKNRRANMGISDSLIRISVGIEDIDDLIEDFDRALRS